MLLGVAFYPDSFPMTQSTATITRIHVKRPPEQPEPPEPPLPPLVLLNAWKSSIPGIAKPPQLFDRTF